MMKEFIKWAAGQLTKDDNEVVKRHLKKNNSEIGTKDDNEGVKRHLKKDNSEIGKTHTRKRGVYRYLKWMPRSC